MYLNPHRLRRMHFLFSPTSETQRHFERKSLIFGVREAWVGTTRRRPAGGGAVALQLRMPGQDQASPGRGRQVDVHHLHGGELLQDGPRRKSRRTWPGHVLQRDVQAVGDEGDEDVRLDPVLPLVEDGPDGQVVLELLEHLLHFGQLKVVPPQDRRILAGAVGAQQVAALAAAGLAQPAAPQRECERLRGVNAD